jgi:hypothetical protein
VPTSERETHRGRERERGRWREREGDGAGARQGLLRKLLYIFHSFIYLSPFQQLIAEREMDSKTAPSKRWTGALSIAMYMFCSISMILSNKATTTEIPFYAFAVNR